MLQNSGGMVFPSEMGRALAENNSGQIYANSIYKWLNVELKANIWHSSK